MKMTAAGKKKRLMAAVVGLWMSLKHFINHSCTHTRLTEMVCVQEASSAPSAESHRSVAAADPHRWLRP